MNVRRQTGRVVTAVLIIAGGFSLLASTQQDRIWWALVWFLVGMTCLSLLLLRVGDRMHNWLEQQQPVWFRHAALVAMFGGLAATVVIVVRQGSPVLVMVSMVVMTLGIIGMYQWLDRTPIGLVESVEVGPDGTAPAATPPRIGLGSRTWYGFEAMAIGIGLFLIADGTATMVGSLFWLFGLVAVKVFSMPYLSSPDTDIERTVRILVDVALLGLFVMFAGAFGSNTVVLLIGLSLLTAALSMVGAGALRLECPEKKAWIAMGGALAAMALVWGWMSIVTQNPGLAFVLGLMIALTGGFFVLRGEGIVLLMLTGYVLAWGLVDRSEARPDNETNGDPVQIVALGDSFISGEGAPTFFEGTNDVGSNQCRRASTAHPYLTASALDVEVLSLACSGAKIGDITTCGQMWADGRRCRLPIEVPEPVETPEGEPPAEPVLPGVGVWQDAVEDDEGRPAGALPQLVTALDRGGTEDVDVVLVSIGGNDVGFSSIVKACLLPKGCDERREIWLETIDLLGPQLTTGYEQIRAVFPNAEVLVVPYPDLVDAGDGSWCDLGLSDGERRFVGDFIEKLDATIRTAAEESGFVFVEEVIESFEGNRLCDRVAAANHLRLVPPAGSTTGRYSPANWIPGSMHPNELGHELVAEASVCRVAQALGRDPEAVTMPNGTVVSCEEPSDDADVDTAAGGDEPEGSAASEAVESCAATLVGDGESPDEGEDAATEDTGEESAETQAAEAACEAVVDAVDDKIDELAAEVAVVTDELVSDDEWIRAELFRTIRALALPLVLLLTSGIVFAWGFARLDNRFSRFLRQQLVES